MSTERDEKHIIGYGTFIAVWVALLVFTGLTIWVASLHLGHFSTFAAMFIATCKALLVVFIFMHLKYEPRVFKVMASVSVLTLTVMILLTFTDVWYR